MQGFELPMDCMFALYTFDCFLIEGVIGLTRLVCFLFNWCYYFCLLCFFGGRWHVIPTVTPCLFVYFLIWTRYIFAFRHFLIWTRYNFAFSRFCHHLFNLVQLALGKLESQLPAWWTFHPTRYFIETFFGLGLTRFLSIDSGLSIFRL